MDSSSLSGVLQWLAPHVPRAGHQILLFGLTKRVWKKFTFEAKIEKGDDQTITLSELGTHLGSRVEIKLDKENTVYKIELEDS